MPKGVQRSEQEFKKRQLEIAHIAAELFFEQGFNETSVSQVAKAAKIGKSTLYDFFSNKDEIILLLLDEPLEEIRGRAREISKLPQSTFLRIAQILHMHLGVLSRDKALILKLFIEWQRLPVSVQAKHEIQRKAYQDILISLIEEGIMSESFRPVNPDVVVKTLLSILSSVLMTSRPSSSSEEMLDQALDIILKGIQR